MAVNVERNRWVRNPEDFAVDLRQRDISGLFKKSIFIEEGTIGLHLIQGRYDKRLEPGEHILEGAIDTAILGGRDRHNIVLIHTGGVTVNITLPRLLTVDPIPFGVQPAVSLQFASGREAIGIRRVKRRGPGLGWKADHQSIGRRYVPAGRPCSVA